MLYTMCTHTVHMCVRICFTESPSVRGIYLDPLEDSVDVVYDLQVLCDIDPTSTADYCEVIARNDYYTASGTACFIKFLR